MTKRVIVIFLDGVGLGDADLEANPFMDPGLPTVEALLGVPHLTLETSGAISASAALLGVDARLNVPGLPQSATGQTTILTGRNAPAILGHHYGPYPDPVLRTILAEASLFKRLREAGLPVAYANAYPGRFLDRLQRGKGRLSANTLAAYMAGLTLRTTEDLRQGRAIPALLSNEFWPEPLAHLPPLTPRQAGWQLVSLAQEHALTFFEFWYSDMVGHRQEREGAVKTLGLLDEFLAGIFERLELRDSLLVVISDHGNFEDLTTGKHTLNPALGLLVGDGFQAVRTRVSSLIDLAPALLAYLELAEP